MSFTENKSSIIREFLKHLRDCAEFLKQSADNIQDDFEADARNPASSPADKKDSKKDYEKFKKNAKKIYKEAKRKIHTIGDSIYKPSTTTEEETSNQIDDDQLLNAADGDESNNIEPATNESNVPEFLPSELPDDKSNTKIRLVAIEKLLDPKIVASTTTSASSIPNTLPRSEPCATTKPSTILDEAESITILDSDEEPEPTGSKPETNHLTNGVKENTLESVKSLKIRINRCKVTEDLLKSGIGKIKVSKLSPRSRSKSRDSTDKNEIRSSKKRRLSSASSSEDIDRNKRQKKSKSSERVERSKPNSRNSSNDDKLRTRKNSNKDLKSNSPSEHKSKSKSTMHKNRVIDDDSESNDTNRSDKEDNVISNDKDIESILKEMELDIPDAKCDEKVPSTSKESTDCCNESTEATLDKGRSETNQSNVDKSNSDEELILNLKKKTSKSSEAKEANAQEECSSSDEEIIKVRKKRKRIRTSSSSDSSSDQASPRKEDSDDSDCDSEDESVKDKKNTTSKTIKGSNDESDAEPETRKTIRKVIETNKLDEGTKKASEAERDRRKRLEERQKLYNEFFENPESAEIAKTILDFDPETKEELLSIDKGLAKRLKPHQVEGVKFMWDACFETIKDIESNPGSGCILGHCMGLGKTVQVVTLSHTLLANSEKTHVNSILIITPFSTVTNWAKEFNMWLKYCQYKDIEVYDFTKLKDKNLRSYKLEEWHEDGGVCIIGYDMFRVLTNPKLAGGSSYRRQIRKCLIDPGPDLIVCDEGHLLKNEKTRISQAISQVRTQRRIVLSGTPLQNNLKEYYCMIQFVKPYLLGTYKEYLNRFVNPITNGQYTDSTERDIRLMKNRSHVLHKMLEGCIQRRDYSVLSSYLPPKHEYVVFIGLSKLQKQLYEHYMKNERSVDRSTGSGSKGAALFKDFQNLRRVWTHPMALRVNSNEVQRKKDKTAMDDDGSSLDDFIVPDDECIESDSSSNDFDDASSRSKTKKGNTKAANSSRQSKRNAASNFEKETTCASEWWKVICSESELVNIHHSPKLLLLFEILRECEAVGDKVLVFSQSLQSLEVIETFLSFIDKKTQGFNEECDVNGFIGSWQVGFDYFRLDGSSTAESREIMCRRFNNHRDRRARLFLISTRAGGLGINLVAANRVIIFDASWNPSHDTQSIFRVYRFGQEKPCYIYRFIAKGTMEEKIYERQVVKQATAKRVIDEQQIGRHYTSHDLMELYKYDLRSPKEREIPILPKDRLFADIIKRHEKYVVQYHEHDSLLENKECENLSESERKAAWNEYENEKNRPVTSQYATNNRPNYRNGPVTSSKIFGFRSDVLLRLLNAKVRRDHPNLTAAEAGGLVPSYLRNLYEEMNTGNSKLYNELNELNQAFEVPTGIGVNPMRSNYIINPFYRPPAAENPELTCIEID